MDKFEIVVKEFVEHEDGSATVTFDMDSKTTASLIQFALVGILTKAAQAVQEEQSK